MYNIYNAKRSLRNQRYRRSNYLIPSLSYSWPYTHTQSIKIQDHTYEWLFRQSGSVASSGFLTHLDSTTNYVARSDNVVQSCPSSSVGHYCVEHNSGSGYSGHRGPVILDFENSAVIEDFVSPSLSDINLATLLIMQAGIDEGSRRSRTVKQRRLARVVSASTRGSTNAHVEGASSCYQDIGDFDCICEHCGAKFWYGERLKGYTRDCRARYHKCCSRGKVRLRVEREPPQYMKQLLRNRRFMDNIRAYNQMFSMTSFGARVDDSINDGRTTYVFKISGEVYHWIGSLCPNEGDPPSFLQLYIYDTENEVSNRMRHFGGEGSGGLDQNIVRSLIGFLDEHNELVRVFRTARDKCAGQFVPDFKIRLYSVAGSRQYDLPTSQTLGGIVFQSSQDTETDYDVIIQSKGGP
nr:helitron helicase-like domain-containing protein [Tanacetum cinerariifolium]